MYNFVAGFLGIDDNSGQYMHYQSVIDNLIQILVNEPDLVNEVDAQIK